MHHIYLPLLHLASTDYSAPTTHILPLRNTQFSHTHTHTHTHTPSSPRLEELPHSPRHTVSHTHTHTHARARTHTPRWHHIYLPLLPRAFKDYLTAPMPFMVGLPAQMLPMLRGIPMDEVTLIDLDLGKCDPPPGSQRDDARMLPWRERLEEALTAVHRNIRSPTEYETSPAIAGVCGRGGRGGRWGCVRAVRCGGPL